VFDSLSLLFDPATVDNPVLNEVFQDRVARTIWLGLKQGHLASDTFDKDCLWVSHQIKEIKDKGQIITAHTLYHLMAFRLRTPLVGTSELAFCEELLPYVLGSKNFTYKVKTEKSA
jgi:hypothetical protein